MRHRRLLAQRRARVGEDSVAQAAIVTVFPG